MTTDIPAILADIQARLARIEALLAPKPKAAKMTDEQLMRADDAVRAFVEMWNELRGGLPKALVPERGSPRWRRILTATKQAGDPRAIAQAVKALAASDFHRGQNDRGWVATIDFLLQPAQFQKWLDLGQQAPAAAKAEGGAKWCKRCQVRQAAPGKEACVECAK